MTSDDDGRKGVLTNRRTLLRGTATAGLFGVGVAGTASAQDDDDDDDDHHHQDGDDHHHDDDDEDESKHGGFEEVTFCASGKSTFSYYLKVDGKVKRGGSYQSDEWDEVGHDYVKGAVAEGRCDSFLVRGTVVDRKFSGSGTVKVGGETVGSVSDGKAEEKDDGKAKEKDDRKAEEKDEKKDDERRLSKVAVVTNPATNQIVNYTFRVTGDLTNLEPDEDSGAALDDVIDLGGRGTRVEGGVSTGDDRFAFSGSLVREDVPPEVEIEIRPR